MKRDPVEQFNISARETDKSRHILEILKNVMDESVAVFSDKSSEFSEWVDEETRERLIEKGYF